MPHTCFTQWKERITARSLIRLSIHTHIPSSAQVNDRLIHSMRFHWDSRFFVKRKNQSEEKGCNFVNSICLHPDKTSLVVSCFFCLTLSSSKLSLYTLTPCDWFTHGANYLFWLSQFLSKRYALKQEPHSAPDCVFLHPDLVLHAVHAVCCDVVVEAYEE